MILEDNIEKVLEEYKDKITEIEHLDFSDFLNIEIGIQISRDYLQKFRVMLRLGTFKSTESEIKFFKHQKPYVYSRLQFYAKIYNFLLQKPQGSIKSQRNFIDIQIKRLQESNLSNLDFIKYYREKADVLDHFYFLRGKDNLSLNQNNCHFYADAEFSTSHDGIVAEIMASDVLINFYVQTLADLKNTELGISKKLDVRVNGKRLGWTASKTDLIELIYALQSSGAIKSGTAGIKEMATACEQIFDIDLGNFYRTFLELRERKIDQTKFIDRLKTSLLKKMNDADS